MKKDTIVQFVCFVTDLGLDDFLGKWERYAKRLKSDQAESTLLREATTKCKFRYISQHEWQGRDFQFSFMNEKRSEHFPEHNVKVIQAGGYTLIHGKQDDTENDDTRLLAFVSHDENDIDFYKKAPLQKKVTIYQAYYENCAYGYIVEYQVSASKAQELALLLKARPGAEVVGYKECMMTQA
ncbi:MAG: hypothetical protein H7Y42_17225 [Chitinophagaceae bacterium]|nr:hypothetical protein [Chitinophagaceae bacterium]